MLNFSFARPKQSYVMKYAEPDSVINCQDPDLNWRHEDFQSTALPTELSRLIRYK
jgi:hypothetical protein